MISSFNCLICGEWGSELLSSSLVLIFSAVAVGTSGMMFLIRPEGIHVAAALLIIFLNAFSPLKILVGCVKLLKLASVISLYFIQSAFLKLMNVLFVLSCCLISVSKVMVIGRWSDPKVIFVFHLVYGRSERLAREISGDVCC